MVCGRLKIELMSDLCAGSGYSYAGAIDSDVSYDAYGIPVIPARRIKGLMREAARLVCPEAVEELFGKAGDRGVKGIVLRNAYIEDYEAVTEELRKLRESGSREAEYLSPQNILKRYTSVRRQTKLWEDTKTVQENTLRYIRVVGQYDPRKERETLCFYARIWYDTSRRRELERIVKAVRNMGMGRNRGLGSVRLSLTDVKEEKKREEAAVRETGEERVCLTYVFCNEEPLLMSGKNARASDSYISGKSILGALAGVYLQKGERNAESEEFRNLFLDGTTIYTNANITFPPREGKKDADKWPDYIPAPLYLNRLKKTGVLVNLLGKKRELSPDEEKAYDEEGENRPQKLKTHYVHETGFHTYEVAEPEREVVYHNSRSEGLYSLEVLVEGQYFRGRIYTERKYAGLLKGLLEKSPLSFGKSKTAQYGACRLAAEITVRDVTKEPVCVEERQRAAVVLASDAVFTDEAMGCTVKFEEVKEQIARRLGIPYDRETDQGSMLRTEEATGYLAVWNLRRPGIPVVKAGSVLVYTIPAGNRWQKALGPQEAFVGERNLEGYGEVRIAECQDMAYKVRRVKRPGIETGEKPEFTYTREFLVSILTERLLERLLFSYIKDGAKLKLTSSTIGRLGMMLRESLEEYREDPKMAFDEFCRRIASVKRTKEREEAFRFLCRLLLKSRNHKNLYEMDFEKMTADRGDSEDPELLKIKELLQSHVTEEEYEERLSGIWGVYMERILAYHKYSKKQEGDSGDDGK